MSRRPQPDAKPARKGQREKPEWQIERMLDEASRLANKTAAAKAEAANPSTQRIPTHLQNRHILPKSASSSRHSIAHRLEDRPTHATVRGGVHADADARKDRVPRDEREAKRMEMDRFHTLLLSLDMSLDDSKKDGNAPPKELQRALKGRFASNQDYVHTFVPLVMEEIRADLLQERVEQGPSSFRPAALRELQPSSQSADFHYFTLALDLSAAGSGGSGREYYENGDCVLVQTRVVSWQKTREEGAQMSTQPLSPLTWKALDFMSAAKSFGSFGKEAGATRFRGGPKSTFEGESRGTPPGSSARDPRLVWGSGGNAHQEKGAEGRVSQGEAGSRSKEGQMAVGAKGEWVARGKPLEFLALVVNAKKEAGPGAGMANGNMGGSAVVLKLKAVRSLDLDKRVGGGSSSSAQTGGQGPKVVWKVLRLKHMGPAIREWRAVCAVRESAGNKGFGRVIARDLLQDILRPPQGSLPTSQQVESVFTALNPTVAQHITNRCNPSQQAAVAAACAAAAIDSAKASGGFTLLQGPPGTGKTSVILHILNFLHLLQYQKYYERKLVELRSGGLQAAPAGGGAPADPATGEGASRKAGVESRDGGAFADILKGIASSSKQSLAGAVAKVPKKPRILVCAPSNAAVDVLVERLLRDRLRDANGFYTPDMIRVGSPSACSERIRVVTLDHQVEEILSRGGGGLEQAKARYRMLLDRREKLRGEAKGFEGELPRGMDGAIIETGQKIEAVQRDIKRLQIIANQKEGDSNEEIKDQLRAKLLEDAQIVFTTLNSSGQEFFARMANGFHTVIIDEACQAVEASTLIPLLLDVRRCILVGDPKQLPATVISTSDTAAQYQRSLFERLMSEGHVVHLLDTQYRMHPAIRQFPSDYFYNGALQDGGMVAGVSSQRGYQMDPWFGTLRFFDLQNSRESRGGAGGGVSLRNKAEAALVAALCKELFRKYSPNGELRGKVCVLTPYRQQRVEIIHVLQRELGRDAVRSAITDGRRSPHLGGGWGGSRARGPDGRKPPNVVSGADAPHTAHNSGRRSPSLGCPGEGELGGVGMIEVMTVDACQGQERDIVIMSCVRANARGAVGFVNDVRRMNVALTRAKHCLLVVGNGAALSVSEPWKAFMSHAMRRRCVTMLDTQQPDFDRAPPEPPQEMYLKADREIVLTSGFKSDDRKRGRDSDVEVGERGERINKKPMTQAAGSACPVFPAALPFATAMARYGVSILARIFTLKLMQQHLSAVARVALRDFECLAKPAARGARPQDPRVARFQKEMRGKDREEGEVSDDDLEIVNVRRDDSRGGANSAPNLGRGVPSKEKEAPVAGLQSTKRSNTVTLLSSSDDDDEDGRQPAAGARKRQRGGSMLTRHDPMRNIGSTGNCVSATVKAQAEQQVRSSKGETMLECASCKHPFAFSNEERQRLLEKGVRSTPSRCRPCRMGKAAVIADAAGGPGGSSCATREGAPLTSLSPEEPYPDRGAEGRRGIVRVIACAGSADSGVRPPQKVQIPRKRTPPLGSSASFRPRTSGSAQDPVLVGGEGKLEANRNPADPSDAGRKAGAGEEERIIIPD